MAAGVEFMIELGDASIAELLMRRFQLLEHPPVVRMERPAISQ